ASCATSASPRTGRRSWPGTSWSIPPAAPATPCRRPGPPPPPPPPPAAARGDRPPRAPAVGPPGMDYKGYNIAVHELGHNVEQVFSLYEVDHTLLAGVPNNAFTEALAFVFQRRDLELLGLPAPDAASEWLRALGELWGAY